MARSCASRSAGHEQHRQIEQFITMQVAWECAGKRQTHPAAKQALEPALSHLCSGSPSPGTCPGCVRSGRAGPYHAAGKDDGRAHAPIDAEAAMADWQHAGE